MRLSKNFWLSEMIKSNTAIRYGIPNVPSTEEVVALTALTISCLQPIRDNHGVVSISSGFRSGQLSEKVNSSRRRQHCKGEAADFECHSIDNKELALWITKSLPTWDQLILEFYSNDDPNSGWIHLSYKRDGSNRKEVKRAIRKGKKTVYENGL